MIGSIIGRPRLRTVLLVINLVILALPLGGIWFLRLYESALIRQTESELMAQAAVFAGVMKAEDHRVAGEPPPAAAQVLAPPGPALAGLDLATDPVLPPPPDPVPAAHPADVRAAAIGAALAPVLRDTQRVTLAALRIVDRDGTIIATTGEDLGQSLVGREEIDRALKGEAVSLLRAREKPVKLTGGSLERAAGLRVFVALPVIDEGRVLGAILLSRTPHSLSQAIYGKRGVLLGVAVLLLGVGAVLAIVAARLISWPLSRIIAQAQRVAAGEVGAVMPLAGYGTREGAELSAAVARLAQTLERRADYIRSFAAHVSHEFKTPLAGAKGAVELIAEHGATMSEEERARFLGVIAASLARLERLTRRLLDLARADMIRPGGAVPLAPLIDQVTARYRDRGLAVTARCAELPVALPPDALDILLSSLIDNAQQQGARRVTIEAVERAGGGAVITVSDDGPGVAADNAGRIFEPFFTTTRETGGTGLGLPIARAIATGAGGSIELVTTAPAGAVFRIVLPVEP